MMSRQPVWRADSAVFANAGVWQGALQLGRRPKSGLRNAANSKWSIRYAAAMQGQIRQAEPRFLKIKLSLGVFGQDRCTEHN